jgi:hypothetical protein
MGTSLWDTHTVCDYCRGRGYIKRGGKSYRCRRCSGVGNIERDVCWCACGCNSLTSSMLCALCVDSALNNGVCLRNLSAEV